MFSVSNLNLEMATIYDANITTKSLPVSVLNFEIQLRRRWQSIFQPDNHKNHYNSLTPVVISSDA